MAASEHAPRVVALGEAMIEFNQRSGSREYLQGEGGDTSNMAIAAARQGVRAAYVTRLGADVRGGEGGAQHDGNRHAVGFACCRRRAGRDLQQSPSREENARVFLQDALWSPWLGAVMKVVRRSTD